ncbi:dephospho-CoA kinase [Aspergillus avenaceus]|uniref:Dephospho-CoA kinase n=1 Tax=Aspergillus avenaceus TaxID=36643 RepID=A0A5N6TTI0_ASPAV|nr:dephospho-CoA kinase [Aspergillus avenaceus]
MLIIGLTGSIATGKSTVSTLLSQNHHIPIIDTDLIARQVVEPGTSAYTAIVNYFGPSTPDLLLPGPPPSSISGEGSVGDNSDHTGNGGTRNKKDNRPLNRPALGRRVFGTSEERQRDRAMLNKIVHPAVRREIYKSIFYYYMRGHWAVVLDVPLLFETGMDIICGTVVVVGVHDPSVQMSRLRARDPHLSAEEAENRVKSQGGVMGKVEKALFRGGTRGVVVWNDGDKGVLGGEVERAVERIRGSSPRWWGVLLWVTPLGVAVGVWNFMVNFWMRKRWDSTHRARL